MRWKLIIKTIVKLVYGATFIGVGAIPFTTNSACNAAALTTAGNEGSSFVIGCPNYSDTIKSKIIFSKENALALAREKGYYQEGEFSSIKLDSVSISWIVVSEKHTSSKKRRVKAHNGECINCRKTNGCTRVTSKTLIIDATNGKIIEEKKKKTYYPNYE